MHAFKLAAAVSLAASLAACATAPPSNPNLELARRNFLESASDPNITSLAAYELKQASDALARANTAWSGKEAPDKVDTLAYVARQDVDIAREVAKRKLAERQVAQASKERDELLLAKRAADADSARRSAEVAQARARQLENELRELAAKETARGTVVTLGNLMFDVNSAQISEGGMRNLRKVADVLLAHPQRTVLIEGFTDSTGSAEHNKELSQQRSDAIRTALVGMGVSPERISARGYGEEFPVADNRTPYGRQINRRVEIVISDDSGKISPRVAGAALSG